MRIRTYLIFSSAMIALVVFIIAAGIFFYQVHGKFTSQEKIRDEIIVDYAYNIINSYFTYAENDLKIFSSHKKVIDALSSSNNYSFDNLSADMLDFVRNNNFFESISILNPDCIVLASDNKDMMRKDLSDRDFCKEIYEKKEGFISGAVNSIISGNPVVAVIIPIFDKDRKYLGFMLGNAELDEIQNTLSKLQDNSKIILIDRNRKVFLTTDYLLKDIEPGKLTEDYSIDSITGDSGFLFLNQISDETVQKYVVSYKKYDYATVVYAQKYNSSVFSNLDVLIEVLFIEGIFTILLVMFLNFFISLMITIPLNELSRRVDEITKGNFDVVLKKSIINEVQKLTESLDRILVSLKLAVLRVGASKEDLGLKKSELHGDDRYKALYETSADALVIIDPDSLKFVSGNPAAINLFKSKDEKEFVSSGLLEFSPEKQQDKQASLFKAKKLVEQAMKDGKNYFEWMFKKQDGEEFLAYVLLSKIRLENKNYLEAIVRSIEIKEKIQKQNSFKEKGKSKV